MTPSPDTTRTAYGDEIREAPPPIPVRARFYLTKCPSCDWVGSSEQCGVDYGCDDSDVYCPVCQEAGCEEDVTCPESVLHGEAVMQRILTAEAERDSLRIRLQEAEREIEKLGRGPSDPGHSRAEPASGLGPTDECPSRKALPIATAPKPLGQILLFGNLKGSAEKCWHIGKWYRGYPKGWWISSSVEVEATHWAPLPALDVETLIALGIEARRVETLGSTCESPASSEAMPEDPSAKHALLTQEESNA